VFNQFIVYRDKKVVGVFCAFVPLHQEYKDSNLWYASSGFVFAITTAILRIANNKHYSSDVLAGQELDYCRNFSD
jgi:membrane-associated phospholipid phosphatase